MKHWVSKQDICGHCPYLRVIILFKNGVLISNRPEETDYIVVFDNQKHLALITDSGFCLMKMVICECTYLCLFCAIWYLDFFRDS